MTSANKKRGNSLERQIVQAFKDAGMEAKRAWSSDGRSMGEHKDVDVLVNYLKTTVLADREGNLVTTINPERIKVQSKKKKKLPDWIGLTGDVDCSVIREDY
jgi:Holliday junction resolvase